MISSQELRRSFVDFFVSNGHVHVPSATLVPDAMSTTLFTIAGMEPFVPAFLGEVSPPAPRAVSVQRCLRVAGAKSDIENVGRTGRHGTFLEMLGNFSFGDYYKRDAIRWAWEYLTQTLRLDADKLYVTVHTSDDDAQRLWETEVGLPAARISRFDADNFWTMGPTGPCGPSSEIFYDTGLANALGPDDTGPNLGNRFVEIWNLVFQQYNRGADGVLTELRTKNIDTGAGFERLLAVANGKASMYETDLFTDLIAAQPEPGESSLAPDEQLVRRRIIADHARAVTFLVADGVHPSNTDRGYVLRFLTRRAIRNGRLLGYPRGFMTALVPAVVRSLESGYPELTGAVAHIEQVVGGEELAFNKTLERGSDMLAALLARAKETRAAISGDDVFVLHDTYGFPSELTREIAGEAGVRIDGDGFEAAMEGQRERARADAHKKRAVLSVADVPATVSEFTGYDTLEDDGVVTAILRDGEAVDRLVDGEEAQLVLDRSSFYAEKGGQLGDRGVIERIASDGSIATFTVLDTQFAGEAIAHRGILQGGPIVVGDTVHTAVDPAWRQEIRRHHTSAHLLQRALKDVLGDEVAQAGSWVGIDRMRFDFRSPSGALTSGQKRDVVARVNAMIRDDHHQVTQVMSAAEAAASGAISMAGEKYGEQVRVVHFGPAVEFCGGTHAHTTGELGMFLIVAESSIGTGIRRIEAVVSKAAEAYVLDQQELVGSLAETLSAKPAELAERVDRLQTDVRDMQKALADIKARLASADAAAYVEGAERAGEKPLVAAVVREANAESLKHLSGAIRQKFPSGVVALAGVDGGTVSLLVSASDDLVRAGVHAGALLKIAAPLVDGRGGGQPSLAQGGGKNPGGASAALDAIRRALAGVIVPLVRVVLGLALAAGAKPAPLPAAEVLVRYEAALASLKRPKAISFEYVVEQLGLHNLEQRHRVYRNGRSERDETFVVDGYTLTRPSVRIFADRQYRYDVGALAPRAAGYTFVPKGKIAGASAYTYVFKTQRRAVGQFAIDEIAIDGRSFLPAIVRFIVTGNGARGRGELRFGQSDAYWVVREALVKVRLSSGARANERITWLNYQFPTSLPPSTFESPRAVPTPEPTSL